MLEEAKNTLLKQNFLSEIENSPSAKIDRDKILQFEDVLKKNPDVFLGDSDLCPLRHSFSDGIYVREIFIPAGIVLTGKIHKHSHPNFLMKGEVDVITEYGGIEHLIGPLSMISSAGTKRIVKTYTDTIWITIHHNPTNTVDLSELEKIVISDSYEEYEKFISNKKGMFNKFISFFKQFKIN